MAELIYAGLVAVIWLIAGPAAAAIVALFFIVLQGLVSLAS